MSDSENGNYDQPSGVERGGTATATQAPPPPPPPPAAPAATAAPLPEPPSGRRSPGAGFAVALIVAGVLLLVARVIPGFTLWNLWPLIIIVAGIVKAVTPGREGWSIYRFFDGLVTVAFGLVFLAITMDVVGWGVWGRVLGLWPALLIAVGFDILGKSLGSSWLRVIGSLVIIATLAYAVAGSVVGFQGVSVYSGKATPISVSEPVMQEESATLALTGGAVDIDMAGGENLVEVRGTTPFGDPTVSVDRSGDTADVRVDLGDGSNVVAWPAGPEANVAVNLSEAVSWDARVEAGLSTVRADLADVPVRSLAIKPGIADCTVTLGDAPVGDEGRVSVQAGISTVRLSLPKDAEIRVENKGGLVATSVDNRLRSVGGGSWETPGYDEAAAGGGHVWVVTVESGIGAFDVDTY